MENVLPNMAQDFIPGEVPTENHIGTYQAQFENIRSMVCSELQSTAADYTMSVQKLVRTCINANLEIANLVELHCNNLLKRFQACKAKLVNHTNHNALFAIDDKMLLVEFDLAHSEHSIMSAKQMQPATYSGQYDVVAQLLLLKQIQCLFIDPIDDAQITIPFNQCMNSVSSVRKQLDQSREVLRTMIACRANTAFDFDIGMSLYTLNFSEDMSMLFWDRYTIVNVTMKSYYVEQYCIVEHTITGDVEPERFIAIHKPSKNSLAQFLADRLCCLTEMVRPIANAEATEETELPQPLVIHSEVVDDEEVNEQEVDPDLEDEEFTDEELKELGLSDADIEEYHRNHAKLDEQ